MKQKDLYKGVIAIIPAREGSKGVPGKNIYPLAGHPLIAYSIIAAKLSKLVERVIVSTDSAEIAEISKHYGAEVPFLRPAQYAGDSSPDIEFVQHAMNWFMQNEACLPEYFVHLRPTTPLRNPAIIDQAIAEFASNKEATSLRSGHPCPESLFKWFVRDEEGYFKGMVSDEYVNLPRQSCPTVYIPDGYVDVLRTNFVKESGELHGAKMIGFVSPQCVEVDVLEDFAFLRYELKKKGSPLLDYLKKNSLRRSGDVRLEI